ncbi:MAG: LPS export ABC transporter periplasmic protein LptC [Zavarzinia sp.]|nr:LPS export ABC transporter periplasmic protein LptC [Zavarzinia sp.]
MARRTALPDRGRPGTSITGSSYSRFVGLMKVLLPLVAVALLAAVLIWPSIESRRDIALTYGDMEIRADGLEMVSPVLTGVDDRGRPYVLTAKGATADGLEPTEVTLREIEADLALQDGKPVKVIAATGLYRLKEEILTLSGGVTVTLADGHVVKLESVRLDLANGTASSDKRVDASGPTGRIAADRLSASDGGHMLRFEGNVRAVITRGVPEGAGGQLESDR